MKISPIFNFKYQTDKQIKKTRNNFTLPQMPCDTVSFGAKIPQCILSSQKYIPLLRQADDLKYEYFSTSQDPKILELLEELENDNQIPASLKEEILLAKGVFRDRARRCDNDYDFQVAQKMWDIAGKIDEENRKKCNTTPSIRKEYTAYGFAYKVPARAVPMLFEEPIEEQVFARQKNGQYYFNAADLENKKAVFNACDLSMQDRILNEKDFKLEQQERDALAELMQNKIDSFKCKYSNFFASDKALHLKLAKSSDPEVLKFLQELEDNKQLPNALKERILFSTNEAFQTRVKNSSNDFDFQVAQKMWDIAGKIDEENREGGIVTPRTRKELVANGLLYKAPDVAIKMLLQVFPEEQLTAADNKANYLFEKASFECRKAIFNACDKEMQELIVTRFGCNKEMLKDLFKMAQNSEQKITIFNACKKDLETYKCILQDCGLSEDQDTLYKALYDCPSYFLLRAADSEIIKLLLSAVEDDEKREELASRALTCKFYSPQKRNILALLGYVSAKNLPKKLTSEKLLNECLFNGATNEEIMAYINLAPDPETKKIMLMHRGGAVFYSGDHNWYLEQCPDDETRLTLLATRTGNNPRKFTQVVDEFNSEQIFHALDLLEENSSKKQLLLSYAKSFGPKLETSEDKERLFNLLMEVIQYPETSVEEGRKLINLYARYNEEHRKNYLLMVKTNLIPGG